METFRVLMDAIGFPLIYLGLVVAAIVVVTHHVSKPKQAPKPLVVSDPSVIPGFTNSEGSKK